MKFLFDQNLPPSLKRAYVDSLHVVDLGLETADDEVVWEYARDHELTLMTKDGDFQHLVARYGPPPKVIWLRVGNLRTAELVIFLAGYENDIQEFGREAIVGMLILGR